MARKDIVTGEGNTFMWDKEGVRAIQETFSINPDMLRNTQDAPEAPKEVKEKLKEAFEKEIEERTQGYIVAEGAELNTLPVFVDYKEDLEKTFHKEGRHLALTANTLGKVWSE